MRRSRLGSILIAPLLAAGGCQPPAAKPVSIDLNRILQMERAEVAGSPPLPKPPPPAPAVRQGVSARRPEVLQDPSRATPGEVRRSLERQQQEAQSTLERRLRDYYKLQADAFELEQNRDREQAMEGFYTEANLRIRLAFEDYADERAPYVARLAVLVGFPDPNPNSEPPKVPLRPVAQAQFDESKRLREQIRTLDNQFLAMVGELLGEVGVRETTLRASVLSRVQQFRDEMNRRAETEAAAEVRTSVRELGLQLTEPNPITVPGTPARTVVIPAEAPLPPAPQVPSVGIPRGLADRRRLLEHELTIWLGLNGYRLAAGARDATQDFQRWRETYQAGR